MHNYSFLQAYDVKIGGTDIANYHHLYTFRRPVVHFVNPVSSSIVLSQVSEKFHFLSSELIFFDVASVCATLSEQKGMEPVVLAKTHQLSTRMNTVSLHRCVCC